MTNGFHAECRATLIGSLPIRDHREAMSLVLHHTPEIPAWPQLPAYRNEGMLVQFLHGLPGVALTEGNAYVKMSDPDFGEDMLAFYEEVEAVMEGRKRLDDSRFALREENAPGFFRLMEVLQKNKTAPSAVKGQITGPITLTTGIHDEEGKAIFYNPDLRDMAVKLLAFKAAWQAETLSGFGFPVIVFFDEPALTGFGSSAFIGMSAEDVRACFDEVIEAVHARGALTGIHVCANAEWPLILDSEADIVNFDAYGYFDKFALYRGEIRAFLDRGGIIAWGIVPTLHVEDSRRETVDSLVRNLTEKMKRLENDGVDRDALFRQSLITPSCGLGSLPVEDALRILELTAGVSKRMREDL